MVEQAQMVEIVAWNLSQARLNAPRPHPFQSPLPLPVLDAIVWERFSQVSRKHTSNPHILALYQSTFGKIGRLEVNR